MKTVFFQRVAETTTPDSAPDEVPRLGYTPLGMTRLFCFRYALLLVTALAFANPLVAKDKDRDKDHDREKDREKAERKMEKITTKPATPGSADPQNASGFDAFRNVKLKNIFDPTRRGMRSDSSTSSTSTESVKRGRSLSLTGTMVTEGRALAFFGGSAAEGNRVVASGDSVAGYKLSAIAATQVALEREGKQLVLQVGRQFTFEADGATGAAEPIVERAPEPAAETTGVPSLPGVSSDKADILRKMMERRAKEVGK